MSDQPTSPFTGRRVVLEDDAAAALVAPLLDATVAATNPAGPEVADVDGDPEGEPVGASAVLRLDQPGWAAALLDTKGPVVLVVGRGLLDDRLTAVLDDTALAAVVVALDPSPDHGPDHRTDHGSDHRPDHSPDAALAHLAALAGSARVLEDVRALLVEVADRPRPAGALAGLARLGTALRPVQADVPRALLPWRVAAEGAVARAWLAGAVRPAPVPDPAADPAAEPDATDHTAHLDVLLVGPDVGNERADALVDAALARGARAVRLPADEQDLGRLHLPGHDDEGALPAAATVRPVDARVVGPAGWQRDTPDRFALVAGDTGELADAEGAALALLDGDHRRLLVLGAEHHTGAARGHLPPRNLAALLQVVRSERGVLDVPELHPSPRAHAALLVTWALAGVPVLLADLPPATRHLLGDELAAALVAATPAELADPDARERRSVLVRRAAWRAHSSGARWRELAAALGLAMPPEPTVSMVLSTNRSDFLDHAMAQARRQRWSRRELVVALHGPPGHDPTVQQLLARSVGDDLPLTVLRVPGDEPLGEALNRAVEASSGDWVTKIDDDDWYGDDHLLDLVLAAEHSGADLVGKAAEFIHLEGADETLRRFGTGQHSASRTIAGTTLTLRREAWRQVGGFARIGLGEDRALVEDVVAAGGLVHRTHGFGLLVRRHGGHAWTVDADYFRQHAVASRPGRDHAWSLT